MQRKIFGYLADGVRARPKQGDRLVLYISEMLPSVTPASPYPVRAGLVPRAHASGNCQPDEISVSRTPVESRSSFRCNGMAAAANDRTGAFNLAEASLLDDTGTTIHRAEPAALATPPQRGRAGGEGGSRASTGARRAIPSGTDASR